MVSSDREPFEQSFLIMRSSSKMKSCGLTTKMHRNEKNMTSGLDGVQRLESQVHEGAVGAFLLKKRRRVEG